MADGRRQSLWSNSNASDTQNEEGSPQDEEVMYFQKRDPGAGVVHDDLFETFSLNGVNRKVLFLKNAQAEMIATNPDSLSKLVQSFASYPPKLVINLCMSKNFRAHLDAVESFNENISPGTRKDSPPFRSDHDTIKVEFADDWIHKIRSIQNYYCQCKDPNVKVFLKNERGKPATMFGNTPISKDHTPLPHNLDHLKFRIDGDAVRPQKSGNILGVGIESERPVELWLRFVMEKGGFMKNLESLKKMTDMFQSVLPPSSISKIKLVRKASTGPPTGFDEPVPRLEQHFPFEVAFEHNGKKAKLLVRYKYDWFEDLKDWLRKHCKAKTGPTTSTDGAPSKQTGADQPSSQVQSPTSTEVPSKPGADQPSSQVQSPTSTEVPSKPGADQPSSQVQSPTSTEVPSKPAADQPSSQVQSPTSTEVPSKPGADQPSSQVQSPTSTEVPSKPAADQPSSQVQSPTSAETPSKQASAEPTPPKQEVKKSDQEADIDWEKVKVTKKKFGNSFPAAKSDAKSDGSQGKRLTISDAASLTDGADGVETEYELVFELRRPDGLDKGSKHACLDFSSTKEKENPYVDFRLDREWNWKDMVCLADVLRESGSDLKPATERTEQGHLPPAPWYLPSFSEFPLYMQICGINIEEEKECGDLLETFMSNTLLPLAAKTNALILCTALTEICALTQALFRVVSTKQRIWGKDMPFTILCTTASMFHLYASEVRKAEKTEENGKQDGKQDGKPDSKQDGKQDGKRFWHGLRDGSTNTWKKRDKIIRDTLEERRNAPEPVPTVDCDLQKAARNFLLVDSLGVAGQEDSGVESIYRLETYLPYNTLIGNLIKHMWKTVPVFAVKTGGGDRIRLRDVGKGAEPSTLQAALELLHSQVPVLWVDVRRRVFMKAANYRTHRLYGSSGVKDEDMMLEEVVEEAKVGFTDDTDLLLDQEQKVADTFDACAVSYFLRVFQSIRTASTTQALRAREAEIQKAQLRLKEAHKKKTCCTRANEMLASCMPSRSQKEDDADSDASNDILETRHDDKELESKTEVARWLAQKMFQHACIMHHGSPERYQKEYVEHIDAMSQAVREILVSEHSFNINLHDGKAIQDEEVTKLAMLSRLPEENGRKGDKLLAEAWLDHDIAMMLADRYKLYTNILFFVKGVVALVTVAMSSYATSIRNEVEIPDWRDFDRSNQGLFVLALLSSALISIEALLKARIRWRQLRAHACTMKKTIWCYRTRVAPFQIIHAEGGSKSPETVLVEVINEWRQSVLSSANLDDTAFEQKYRNRTFKHTTSGASTLDTFGICNCRCLRRMRIDNTLLKEQKRKGKSDWYAPVEPKKYIKMRIEKSQQFYTKRIPGYVCWNSFWQAFAIILSLVTSVLAYFQEQAWLVVAVAFSTTCLSWVEFRDHTRKTARYTHVALGLRNLITWWNNLTLVERASAENIQRLVSGSEELLMTEMNAWISVSNEHKEKASVEVAIEPKAKPVETE